MPVYSIPAIDPALTDLAQNRMDGKTKPPGSLGRLEELAVRLCGMQNTLHPHCTHPAMFTFAADHGIAEEGVSAFPQEVTVQMVQNFGAGGAAINVLCAHYGIDLRVIDMGVKGNLEYSDKIRNMKVRNGTDNCAKTCAMSQAEAQAAVDNGSSIFRALHAENPIDILGLGEMGIGNSSSATLIIAMACGLPVAQLAGRGTGLDDSGLQHKIQVLEKAIALHGSSEQDGLALLQKVGGLEIAGMAGAALAAAAERVPVVLDGIISTAAGLIAYLLNPSVREYFFVAHASVEKAQAAACRMMDLEPIVDLSMRLGEGTGAAIVMDLIRASADVLEKMASFEEAGIA